MWYVIYIYLIFIIIYRYDKPVDIWSVGCIFAELLGRKPLFPGNNYLDQLEKIISIVGSPTQQELKKMKVADQAYKHIMSMKPRKKVPFSKLFPNANPHAVNLLEKMLTFSPLNRITAKEALAHPYFAELHDEDDEPVCDKVLDFSFEKKAVSTSIVKGKKNYLKKIKILEMIYEEILKMHPDGTKLTFTHYELEGSGNSQTKQDSSSSSSTISLDDSDYSPMSQSPTS